jgi:hypothetical protein
MKGVSMMTKWIAGLLISGLGAAANAQVDWPTFRGQNTRTGVTSSIFGVDPGQPTLRWYFPLQSTRGRTVAVDNPSATFVGGWTTPPVADESPDFYAPNGVALTNPYMYSAVVPSTAGSGDATAGSTARATWRITGLNPGTFFAVSAWFPSSGTSIGGVLAPNAAYATYKIEYADVGGVYREFVDVVPHIGGGSWVRLGNNRTSTNRIFEAGTSGEIRVTLYNSMARDPVTDALLGPTNNTIVCADAVQAVPQPGEIWGSPVVANVGPTITDNIVVVPRNESRVDPTDSTGTTEINLGILSAIDASGGNIGQERWNWSPNLIAANNQTFDNSNPVFNADAAWLPPGTTANGYYLNDYVTSPVAPVYPGTGVARWTPTLPQDGYYDVYAWFPRSGNGELHARAARYVIDENGSQTEVFVDQDTRGGNWVRLGTRPYLNDALAGGLKVEVWNYSNNPGDTGRVVCADAVMFVGSYTGAMFSTPTIATVNLRLSGGGTQPTPCVFVASQDGRIYCLDARGNGTGATTLYWAYPSIPDTNDPTWTDPNDTIDGPAGNRIPWPGSFGVSSMVVQRVGGKDLLYIAANNGRVYAIDCEGRGDYDAVSAKPGTTMREWTWPKAKFTQSTGVLSVDPARPSFVASVAFDPTNNQIFAAGTEGRIFALDAAGNNDQTTNMVWAFPTLSELPIGAISSTPAIGGGRVIFPSYDGHVYARDLTGNVTPAANWMYPASGATALQPFQFTSVCYVTSAQMGGLFPTDLAYFVNEDGNLYCVSGVDGTIQWQANEVPGGAQSSPAYGRISPPGTGLTDVPIITFGTNVGEFLGFYAIPGTGAGRQNSAGGRLAWGYQSAGERVFASPAVSYSTDGVRGFIYHAGIDGFLYAFREGGLITVDPGFPPPGQVIDTPDDTSSTDFINLKFKIISKADYSLLRANPATGNPATMTDAYGGVPVLEFGERLYVVAYDFILQDPNNPPTIRFRLTGPGGLNLQYDRPAQPDPTDPAKGFATMAIPINYTGPNFITPGDILQVDVLVVNNGRIINPPVVPRNLAVANPLAISTEKTPVVPPGGRGIGWSSDPNYVFNGVSENKINGSNDKAVISSVGQVSHGTSGNTPFFVSDRSRVIDLTGTGLAGVRAIRGDGMWQGSVAAVRKPLPYAPAWEVLPFSVPNLSPDYPDIDRSQIGITADPNRNAANPLLTPVRLDSPLNYDPNNPLTRLLAPVRFQLDFDVPRFQPANLTIFTDASGAQQDGGYRSRTIIYVDSNNNGKPDGQPETLVDLPPGGRREPYRSMNIGGSVPVDEKMHITQQTVDLGSLPHSLGYTPGYPWTNNGFIPSIAAGATYRDFFKPFTVINDGNVNMLDLRVARQIGPNFAQGYYSVAFNSDANDALAWLDGVPNIISNVNPPYAPNLGALDASGNPRVTLHKARPGNRAGTTLTIPDVPYGTTAPANSQPLIGVAVPLGLPVGEYSQLINVVEDNFLVGGKNDLAIALDKNGNAIEPYTDPTMRVKFINREARITGGQTYGTVPHIDANLAAPSNFTHTNSQPTAFRDGGGKLHLGWSATRPGPANQAATAQSQDSWKLFFSSLLGASPQNAIANAGGSPFRDLMSWNSGGSRFWSLPQGPAPTEPVTTLFAVPGATVVGGVQFTSPSFPVNARRAVNATSSETVAWNGKALMDETGDGVADREENRIFFAQYSVGGGTLGGTQWIAQDPRIEKKRIRVLNLADPQRLAIFWFGEVNGVSRMFQNTRTTFSSSGGDQTMNWSKNIPIDPGEGFAATRDPQPILRGNFIELVFTGVLRDRPQPEVFLAKFSAGPTGQLGNLMNQPDRNREALVRESGTGTYRARGVNWEPRQPIEVWLRRPNQAPVRIDVPATRATDDSTGVITFDSLLGGKIYCDRHTGTVRMTSAPGSDAQVELRYTPRVIRVSDLGSAGGHSNPSSFLDDRIQWDRQFYFTTGGQAIANPITPVYRIWHIYERGATGPGQTKRPYMKTQRLMVRLNHPVALNNNGQVVSLNIAGNVGPYYQVDPGNACVYFEPQDEGRTVTITYSWRNSNGFIQSDSVQGAVMWQTEMSERPVPIEQAIDEGTVFAFADPFQFANNDPRCGLVWVFFTSSRAGTRDVYYLTLAPKLTPRWVP